MTILHQAIASRYLARGLASNRLSPALIFCGPEGTGKRAMALETAKAFTCLEPAKINEPDRFPQCGRCDGCRKADDNQHPDVLIVDAALQASLLKTKTATQRNIRIDTIRHMNRFLWFKPAECDRRVVILEDAHLLTNDAANTLLKSLEEPPSHGQIILLAIDEENLPSTIRSRCAIVRFRPLPTAAIAQWLREEKDLDENRARDIAHLSGGSLTRATKLIEKEPFAIDLNDYDVDKFFDLVSDPRFREDARGKAETIIAHLIETAQTERDDTNDVTGTTRRLQALLAARRQIDRFVPPRLVLENLFLNIKK